MALDKVKRGDFVEAAFGQYPVTLFSIPSNSETEEDVCMENRKAVEELL
jgi:hypothetical protein